MELVSIPYMYPEITYDLWAVSRENISSIIHSSAKNYF